MALRVGVTGRPAPWGQNGVHQRRRDGGSLPMRGSPAAHALASAYEASMLAHPLLTKAATSGVLWTVSDAAAQRLTVSEGAGQPKLDLGRLLRYAFFGAAVQAPLFDAYYRLQDNFVDTMSVSTAADVGVKLLIDQLIYTPFVYLPLFFGGMAVLESASKGEARLSRAVSEARVKGFGLTATLVANWTYWVPVNLVNYAAVPLEFRVLYNNLASLVWTVYLSRTQNKQEAS